MRLIVGLGNPGREYAETRHNVGFWCVDLFAERHRLRFNQKKARSQVATGEVHGQRLTLAKPMTYMNLSGEAIRQLLRELGVPPKELLVVYDDVDLPLGKLRIRSSGSAGTHNGMRSIVSCLGTQDFPRLRIGIGRPDGVNLVDHVLTTFDGEEMEIALEGVKRAADAVDSLLIRGMVPTATEFNR